MSEQQNPDDGGGGLGGLVGDWVSGAFGDALQNLADAVLEGVGAATASVSSVWVLIGTPNLTRTGEGSTLTPAGASDPASGELVQLANYIAGIGMVVCVISLIWLGMMVGASIRRGEGAMNVGRGGAILAGALVIGASGAIVGTIMPDGPRDAAGATLFLQSTLWWYTAAVAAIAVIIGGIRMAWFARAEEGKDLVKSLLTLLVVAAFGVTGTQMLVTLSDSFSIWILSRAIDCDVSRPETDCFGENMLLLLPFQSFGLGAIITIVLGLIAILISAFQIVLMVARSGMLVILAGILPLSAAATNTEMGKAWFKRSIGWLLAFILYKPAAAIVYAAAFRLMATDVFRNSGDGLLAVLTGMMLMVLALFALTALMRFVTPLVSTTASGSGGAAVGAAAMTAMPTGASQLGGLFSKIGNSSASDPGPGDSTPSSATGAADGGSGPVGGPGADGAPTGGDSTSGTGSGSETSGTPDGAEAADATGGAEKAAVGAQVPAGAATGAAAGGGTAAAGAAAGPAGMAAGAALDAVGKAGQAASGAAQAIGQESTGQQEEGPSGSR